MFTKQYMCRIWQQLLNEQLSVFFKRTQTNTLRLKAAKQLSVFVDSGAPCGQRWNEHHHLVWSKILIRLISVTGININYNNYIKKTILSLMVSFVYVGPTQSQE